MPNMSYCRFENTYIDLIDCFQALKDEGLHGIESKRERDAAEDLMKLALRYVDAYKEAHRISQAEKLGITPDE